MEWLLFWLLMPPTFILLWLCCLITVLVVIDSWDDIKRRFK